MVQQSYPCRHNTDNPGDRHMTSRSWRELKVIALGREITVDSGQEQVEIDQSIVDGNFKGSSNMDDFVQDCGTSSELVISELVWHKANHVMHFYT